MNDIDNTQDMIDSRDIEARIADIDVELMDEPDDDLQEELDILRALGHECGHYADWDFGAQLIRDSYFTEYAQQLAEDIGAVDHSGEWPMGCIDWDWAARELQMDYTCVDFDGVEYWIRA